MFPARLLLDCPAMSATVDRQTLVSYLDQLLDAGRGRDYGPNGLQVEGRETIRKVVTGVSACHELFDRAREAGADAVLVHHGIFWEGMPAGLTASKGGGTLRKHKPPGSWKRLPSGPQAPN
jgi:NIF3 (NGG1p interacting factor 3)